MPGTGSLTGSDEEGEGTGAPSQSEAPVSSGCDCSQVVAELQRLEDSLGSWVGSPGDGPAFGGVTVQVMFSLFFAAFAGGFCLSSLVRISAYAVRVVRKLLGRL